MKAGNAAILTLFTLFWTAIVGVADWVVGMNLYRTVRALEFAETTGTVVASDVVTRPGSRGRAQYAASIRYRYQSGNATLEGDRLRFGSVHSTSNRGRAELIVRNHPAGATVKVYYDRTTPANAVLDRGIDGESGYQILFLIPFNLVMVSLWWMPLAALVRKIRPRAAGGVKWFQDGRLTRIRLPEYPPAAVGMAVTGLVAFLGSFVLAFGFGGSPGLNVALGTVALAVAAGVIAAGRLWLRQLSGIEDLVLDEVGHTLELPLNCGRKQRRVLPLSSISGITVAEITHRSRKGGTRITHAVTLHLGDSEERLTDWGDESRAGEFAAWLQGRLMMAGRV